MAGFRPFLEKYGLFRSHNRVDRSVGDGSAHGYRDFQRHQNYQEDTTSKDIRANRLLATLDTSSKVELLDDAMKETISSELAVITIRPEPLDNLQPWKHSKAGQPAVSSAHLSTQAQLFIHNSKEIRSELKVRPSTSSPLLSKLTFQGKPLGRNPLEDASSEGIIV